MSIKLKISNAVRNFLEIQSNSGNNITINEEFNYDSNAFMNKIWYRGNANELDQAYSHLDSGLNRFWGATSSSSLGIRKLHSGLPKIIVNSLTNIIIPDLNGYMFKDKKYESIWEEIAKDNSINNIFKKALKETLYIGDGAFKISLDKALSEQPIIEWFSGQNIEYKYIKSRLSELVFRTYYKNEGMSYTLAEYYGYGYVHYKLFNKNDIEVDIQTLDETANLIDVEFKKDIMLAVPFMIYDSEEFEGRGESIYEGKKDNFDAFDEVYGQWMQSMRDNRSKTYIPESLLNRDPTTGKALKPNPFDCQFIRVADAMGENNENRVITEQGEMFCNEYSIASNDILDKCLQGIVSPSTLGIDSKKVDNAEAQREKEKTTLYTRQNVIEAMSASIKELINVSINALNLGSAKEDIIIDISWGQYANPSFEAQIQTLSSLNIPMSVSARVEELWGDTRDKAWKEAETLKILNENNKTDKKVDEPEPIIGMAPLEDEEVEDKNKDIEIDLDEDENSKVDKEDKPKEKPEK